jgi:hypothetical protein
MPLMTINVSTLTGKVVEGRCSGSLLGTAFAVAWKDEQTHGTLAG